MQNQSRALQRDEWPTFIYYPFTEYIMPIPFNQKYKNENGIITNKISINFSSISYHMYRPFFLHMIYYFFIFINWNFMEHRKIFAPYVLF